VSADDRHEALFIGHTYIDVTLLADSIPTGDDKDVAKDYAVSFGGNAVTAAFACAKLHPSVGLICTLADDWLGRMFREMAERYEVELHPWPVKRSSLSFIMPNGHRRAILRARDDGHIGPPPHCGLDGCRVLHLDGHMGHLALEYAQECRARGILTSLDGGSLRDNTHELLAFIDVAVVSERLCEQMNLTPDEMLAYLRERGCRVGAVTEGERGVLWYDGPGAISRMSSLAVPHERIVDTSGAGDVFHGAYVASYLDRPEAPWSEHLHFARAASAHKIQFLGNEAGLPTLADVERARAEFE
jgi:sugar/nucleoside kinase (ribokinase family)